MYTTLRQFANWLVTLAAAAVILLSPALRVAGDDWPMFGRDATHNGVSPEKNPPLSWRIERKSSVKRPSQNVEWVAELGTSTYGDPVVAGGFVWIGTNSYFPGNDDRNPEGDVIDGTALMCFRESDGKLLYSYVTPRLKNRQFDWPTTSLGNSPLVESDRLWFTTNAAEVVCLDIGALRRGDGQPRVLWRLDMYRDLNVRPFGADGTDIKRCSVAGFKDWIYVNTGEAAERPRSVEKRGPAPSLLCLEKATGHIVWKDNLPRESILEFQPGSPLVAEINGRAQVIIGQGDGWLRSFDAATGAVLWKFDINPKTAVWKFGGAVDDRNHIPATPVLYDGRVYISSGRGHYGGTGSGRLCCIDPTRTGDISAELAVDADGREIPHRPKQAVDPARGEKAIANPNSGLLWENAGSATNDEDHMSGMIASVAIADGLVIAPDTYGYVRCFDAKAGKKHWTFDARSMFYASPLIVDGHVYIADEDGDVAILRLSADPKVALPDGKPLAEMNVDSSVYCSPIFANGTLYIASWGRMFAIRDASAQQTPAEPDVGTGCDWGRPSER